MFSTAKNLERLKIISYEEGGNRFQLNNRNFF